MAAKVLDSSFLTIARAAYRAPEDSKPCGVWSSDNYCAWMCGKYMKATGRSEPWEVRKNRGYYWTINDMRFKWLGQPEDFERKYPDKTFQRMV